MRIQRGEVTASDIRKGAAAAYQVGNFLDDIGLDKGAVARGVFDVMFNSSRK